MRSLATDPFWRLLDGLPSSVRRQAREAFRLFTQDPFHPSLRFKKVQGEDDTWSARVGIGYRVLGIREKDRVTWFWIGSHSDYDKLV